MMKKILTTLAAVCVVLSAGATVTPQNDTPEKQEKGSVWSRIFPPLKKNKAQKVEAETVPATDPATTQQEAPAVTTTTVQDPPPSSSHKSKKELEKENEELKNRLDRIERMLEALGGNPAPENAGGTSTTTPATGQSGQGQSTAASSHHHTGGQSAASHAQGDTTKSIYALQRKTAGNQEGNYNMDNVHFTSNVSDDVMIQRLKAMNSFIDLPYNETVKNWMILYSEKMPSRMSQMLGLAEYYMPIFEKTFLHYGLPEELKYLAIIESALNPVAVSRAGATGMWQFMYSTAKNYGLEINSYVDERRDPYKSADAAARYLKDAYALFGDWSLAISSYNCGAGNVNKAIKRAGGSKQFWDIYPYLPSETRGYVPAMVGAMYAVKYHKEYGIRPAPIEIPGEVDTFHIHKNLGFDQIVACTQITKTELRDLNPQYYKDVIPGNSGTYILRLHADRSDDFLSHQDSIYAHKSSVGGGVNVEGSGSGRSTYAGSGGSRTGTTTSSGSRTGSGGSTSRGAYTGRTSYGGSGSTRSGNSASSGYSWKYYKVRNGDTLSKIAQRNGVSINQIKTWNGLRSNTIHAGQQLKVGKVRGSRPVYTGGGSASTGRSGSTSRGGSAVRARITVKQGETLSSIARRYGTTPEKIMKASNKKSTLIRPGDKLVIPAK